MNPIYPVRIFYHYNSQLHIEELNDQKALTLGQERIQGTINANGEFRKVPHWIGPTERYEDAVYIPVSANKIEEYMNNWGAPPPLKSPSFRWTTLKAKYTRFSMLPYTGVSFFFILSLLNQGLFYSF
jgi:hypothetical protein